MAIDLKKFNKFKNKPIFLNNPQLLIPENPYSNNLYNKLSKGNKFIIINKNFHFLINHIYGEKNKFL